MRINAYNKNRRFEIAFAFLKFAKIHFCHYKSSKLEENIYSAVWKYPLTMRSAEMYCILNDWYPNSIDAVQKFLILNIAVLINASFIENAIIYGLVWQTETQIYTSFCNFSIVFDDLQLPMVQTISIHRV